jgi:hypothetical protein
MTTIRQSNFKISSWQARRLRATRQCRSIATAGIIRNQSITGACAQCVAQWRRSFTNNERFKSLPAVLPRESAVALARLMLDIARRRRSLPLRATRSACGPIVAFLHPPLLLPPRKAASSPRRLNLCGVFLSAAHAVVMSNRRLPGHARAWSPCSAHTGDVKSCAHSDPRRDPVCHRRRRSATNAPRALCVATDRTRA